MEKTEHLDTGDYSAPWTETFDYRFVFGWLIGLVVLSCVTYCFQPDLIYEYKFFGFCAVKLAAMVAMGIAGGMICRHYCRTDAAGYIVAGSGKWFKVNYTRKLQHFAAYLIPLLSPATAPHGLLPHAWESLFVLLMFLILIKPLRERCTPLMLQFNAMDRPEDRPNTLRWIVVGNLLPALVLGTLSRQLFEYYLNEPHLPLIIIMIIGIGDGLAEPVGIYLGKKKYTVPAWNMDRRYERSYAGSACVLISGFIFVALFYKEFNTLQQFITAMILIPPAMTYAEAYSPHSMDTPIMMMVGFSLLAGICML